MDSPVSFLIQVGSAVPGPWLYVGACVGHAYWLVIALNFIFAFYVHHRILDITRKFDFLLIFAGPVIFALAFHFPHLEGLSWPSCSARYFLSLYTVVCFLLGAVAAPVFQIFYWLRPQAPQIVSKTVELIDVSRHLGYIPHGVGRHARMARFPGNCAFHIEFVELHLRLSNIPDAWEGLTILHLSDLHFIGRPDKAFHHFAIQKAMSWGVPDLVCVTGDIVDSAWHHRWIVPILGQLRWKVAGLAILGNHDKKYDDAIIRRRLARIGLDPLGNQFRKYDVRGHPLVVLGQELPWFGPQHEWSQCPAGSFKLCLSHTPDHIAWARKHRIDLMLAGHLHGGQVRLPWIGSVFVPSRYSRRFDCGTFYRDPTLLHVSRGLAGQHPFRLNCYPEITRIVLHK